MNYILKNRYAFRFLNIFLQNIKKQQHTEFYIFWSFVYIYELGNIALRDVFPNVRLGFADRCEITVESAYKIPTVGLDAFSSGINSQENNDQAEP